jgi:serine protease Do
MVDNPQDGSPAAKAGIEAGDVITAVNGTPVKDSRDLARTISMMAPSTSVKLDVLHKGETKQVALNLGEMPNEHQANAGKSDQSEETAGTPHLGLNVAPAREVDGAGDKGAVVMAVDPDGPAAEHGLKTGDVILNVGGNAVSNAGDVRSALVQAKADGKKSVLMQVKTADTTRYVAVPFAKG